MIGGSFDSHLNCSHHLLLVVIGEPYTANTIHVRSIKIMEVILRIYNTYTSFVSLGNHCLDLHHPILFSPQSQSFSTGSKNLAAIYAINAKNKHCLMIWACTRCWAIGEQGVTCNEYVIHWIVCNIYTPKSNGIYKSLSLINGIYEPG